MCLKPEISGLPLDVNHGTGLFRYVALVVHRLRSCLSEVRTLTASKVSEAYKAAHVLIETDQNHARNGSATLRRIRGAWAKLDPPVILGYDIAGMWKTLDGVNDFRTGDQVYYTPEILGNPPGSHAYYYNVVSAAIVARKPTGLSFVEASAIPLAGGTAWEAVIRRAAVRPGETILIHGAAGGSVRSQFDLPKPQALECWPARAHQDLLRRRRDHRFRKNHAAEITLRGTYGYGAERRL